MRVFRIDVYLIAADIPEEAALFFTDETGIPVTGPVIEVDVLMEVEEGGRKVMLKDLMNRELDSRNEWLRMGVPCELHWPFIIHKSGERQKA
ncbi:MAG: hypothetical protein PHG91_05335 [Syntrophales bacterium]|nr:hypothetical protein [Syntrophales bacterium]MDD5232800.1 hypothetical protein [Syntrophales bacterium]HPL62799.1 hypothetical protein [Syntrophales bacterium]